MLDRPAPLAVPLLSRCAVLLGALALATPALGGGPRTERIAGHEAFSKGTLEGVSLDADGVLGPGPVYDALALEADTAWAAAADGEGLWVGTGNQAALLHVDAESRVRRFELGGGLMVTAVAALPGGGAAAAVFPGARVYHVAADGTVSLRAALGVEHIWALVPDGRGGLTAACGGPGSVHRIDPLGATSKLADVDDDHARCLVASGETLFVGTAPKGRVLALDRGALRVVRDLEPQEVVGLVVLEDGGLLVAANADQAGGNAQTLANLLRQIAEPSATKPGTKPAPRAALQDGHLFHLEPEGVLTTLWTESKVALLGLSASGRGAVAGTYPGGRVVHVEPGGASTLLADLPEAEASVVLGEDLVVTSNPVVLHRRRASVGRGTWTSAPLDGGAPSTWGRVSLWGNGIGALHARGGETQEPDGTWSAWDPVEDFDGRGGRLGLETRFVQLRAMLDGPEASLRSVEVVTRTPNRAPVISEITVKKPGAKEGAPPEATPKREIAWKAEDPDGDRLRATVEVNRRGSPLWSVLVDREVLEKSVHVWDTTGVADGTYQVRVRVDDGEDNVAVRARRSERLHVGVRVDNTAPTASVKARRLGGGRIHVEGDAGDAHGGRILSVRVSIDGGPWVVLAASDGLYDASREAFQSVVRVPEGGAHDVVVQVTDADGNIGTAATVVE